MGAWQMSTVIQGWIINKDCKKVYCLSFVFEKVPLGLSSLVTEPNRTH